MKTILDKTLFVESLKLYGEQKMDIQDIMLAVIAKSARCSLVTFDRKDLRKLGCEYSEP
jgi:predicted nucleic-acid-binding protein